MSRLSQEEFDLIYSKVPRLCVDLVIQNEEGVLLTLRTIPPAGVWHIPGGTVAFDESVEDAVKRVALFELGVKVKIDKLLGIIDCFKNPLLPNQHPVAIEYAVSIIEGEIKLNDEASDFGFFKDLPENTADIHKEFIEKEVFKI